MFIKHNRILVTPVAALQCVNHTTNFIHIILIFADNRFLKLTDYFFTCEIVKK